MFLESSRSKFIGYTLGRWVLQSRLRELSVGGGAVAEAAGVGAAATLRLASSGLLCCQLLWVVVPDLPVGWVARDCSCLRPAQLFPFSPVTPTQWWGCPGPSMKASEP